MEIRTEDGIAKPMPLSDLQQYNKRLEYHSKVLRFGIVIGGLLGTMFLIVLMWVIWYTIYNNVLNNIVARCVC